MTATRSLALAGAAVVAAILLVACGSGSSRPTVFFVGTGPAIGELTCYSIEIDPDDPDVIGDEAVVPQGSVILVTWLLADANLTSRGRNLPVSFEPEGGSVPNPPQFTDDEGTVTATFVASTTHAGPGSIRLIQPDSYLICDVDFSIVVPACTVTSRVEILALDDSVVSTTGFDACPAAPIGPVERHLRARVTLRVTRPTPDGMGTVPAAGEMIRLDATGFDFATMTVGPTNGAGEVVVDDLGFPASGGDVMATLRATVLVEGDFTLPCPPCTIDFAVTDSTCDDDGLSMLPPTYLTASGMAPVRPGESATMTAFVLLDGVPQAGVPVTISAGNGMLDGFASALVKPTAMDGSVTVAYAPNVGFAGTDTLTFRSASGMACEQEGSVTIVTCELAGAVFMPAPTAGMPSTVTVTLDNMAPATVAAFPGVFLAGTRGAFVPTGNTLLMSTGPNTATATGTYLANAGPGGDATLAVVFGGGLPCDALTTPFAVAP